MERHFTCGIAKLVTMASDGLHINVEARALYIHYNIIKLVTMASNGLHIVWKTGRLTYDGIQWIAFGVEGHFIYDIVKLVTMESNGLHIMWKDTLHYNILKFAIVTMASNGLHIMWKDTLHVIL